MKTVYRYEINSVVNDVVLPANAKILSVGLATNNKLQFGKEIISIWALVDTDNSVETRRFLVYGTGADMTGTETYELIPIGTVQKSNQYAFHVFEVR